MIETNLFVIKLPQHFSFLVKPVSYGHVIIAKEGFLKTNTKGRVYLSVTNTGAHEFLLSKNMCCGHVIVSNFA